MSSVITFIKALLKISRFFIDRVVGQVHEQIVEVAADRRLVNRSSKSCKTFFVYVYSQWLNACYKHIDPKVKLKSINQVGLVQVTLCYVVLIRLYPLKVSREEYPFSL
jgi:hypothetical protein